MCNPQQSWEMAEFHSPGRVGYDPSCPIFFFFFFFFIYNNFCIYNSIQGITNSEANINVTLNDNNNNYNYN